MTRHGGDCARRQVLPHAVGSTFAQQVAPVTPEVLLQVATFHHRSASPDLRESRELRYSDPVSSLIELTAVYEPVEDGWIQARIVQLPGVITAAASLEEAKQLLVDALREYLLALGGQDGAFTASGATVEQHELALTLIG